MKWSTFAIASGLMLALFVFAQRRTTDTPQSPIAAVVDLTHSINTSNFKVSSTAGSPDRFATHIDAPAQFVRGAWSVDEIPTNRLVAPLVVIDAQKSVASKPDYQVSMTDLAEWEQANGPVPLGAVVIARTGWSSRWYRSPNYVHADAIRALPGFSPEAVKFLVDARQIVALGTDTPGVQVEAQESPVQRFAGTRQVYHLENVANLEKVPESGATAVIAPAKVQGASGAPVRILALVN